MVSLGLLMPRKSVLISQYERRLDNYVIHVLIYTMSRVAEQGSGIRVGLGGG
jgi:hypothetical protein